MAKLKSEVKHQHHEAEGASLRERLFANIDAGRRRQRARARLELGGRTPGRAGRDGATRGRRRRSANSPRSAARHSKTGRCSRWPVSPVAKPTAKSCCSPIRTRTTRTRRPARPPSKRWKPRTSTSRIPDDTAPSGRAAYSIGMLDTARDRAETTSAGFGPRHDGWSVVFVEPSDAVMFQDEYLDLLDGTACRRWPTAPTASWSTSTRADSTTRCRSRTAHWELPARSATTATVTRRREQGPPRRRRPPARRLRGRPAGLDVLRHGRELRLRGRTLRPLEGHGRHPVRQVDDSEGDRVVAPGGSCRSQLGDRDGVDEMPPHPIEVVAERVPETTTS